MNAPTCKSTQKPSAERQLESPEAVQANHAIHTDVAIVGGGIGGAGLAYFLAAAGAQVVVLEREDLCGYHTTGRSAAFFAESYGGPGIRPLTAASRAFFDHPPAGFTETPLLTPRGALHLYGPAQQSAADAMLADLDAAKGAALLAVDTLADRIPHVCLEDVAGAVFDPTCADIDVANLLACYLRGAKQLGARVLNRAGLRKAKTVSAKDLNAQNAGEQKRDGWLLETDQGLIQAKILVNAAGAWADHVAKTAGVPALGVTPKRRTIATTDRIEDTHHRADLPLVLDIDETVYFKPEGAGFLISPADETPVAPQDVQPEAVDVARAVDRFERRTGAHVDRLIRSWAGLRSFAPDRLPIIGPDSHNPRFFWSVGQGGWGIQTSPAWSALLAGQILTALGYQPDPVYALVPAVEALDPGSYAPARL